MISERIEIESGDGRKALLSCFIKENTAGRPNAVRKAVVVCPGGSYAFCATREGEPVACQFLAMDCQAFVLNYTAPAPFPRALCQLAEAVAYIRSRAEEWHIDPNGIFVCGFSAGGHLAASLGVFWNREFVWKTLGASAGQVRPDGLILCYPVISFGEYGHMGSYKNLQGGEKQYPEEFLSLEKQAGPHVPPVFLRHTDTDLTVPAENALLFAWALRRAGVSLELHIFHRGRHGLSLATEETSKDEDDKRGGYVEPVCQAWIPLVRAWIRAQEDRCAEEQYE